MASHSAASSPSRTRSRWKSRYDALHVRFVDLSDKLTEAQADNEKLTEKVHSLNRELELQEREAKILENDFLAIKNENNDLRRHCHDNDIFITNQKRKEKEFAREIIELKDELKRADSDIAKFEEQQRIDRKLQMTTNTRYHTVNRDQQQRIAHLTETVDKFSRELEEAKEREMELRHSIEELIVMQSNSELALTMKNLHYHGRGGSGVNVSTVSERPSVSAMGSPTSTLYQGKMDMIDESPLDTPIKVVRVESLMSELQNAAMTPTSSSQPSSQSQSQQMTTPVTTASAASASPPTNVNTSGRTKRGKKRVSLWKTLPLSFQSPAPSHVVPRMTDENRAPNQTTPLLSLVDPNEFPKLGTPVSDATTTDSIVSASVNEEERKVSLSLPSTGVINFDSPSSTLKMPFTPASSVRASRYPLSRHHHRALSLTAATPLSNVEAQSVLDSELKRVERWKRLLQSEIKRNQSDSVNDSDSGMNEASLIEPTTPLPKLDFDQSLSSTRCRDCQSLASRVTLLESELSVKDAALTSSYSYIRSSDERMSALIGRLEQNEEMLENLQQERVQSFCHSLVHTIVSDAYHRMDNNNRQHQFSSEMKLVEDSFAGRENEWSGECAKLQNQVLLANALLSAESAKQVAPVSDAVCQTLSAESDDSECQTIESSLQLNNASSDTQTESLEMLNGESQTVPSTLHLEIAEAGSQTSSSVTAECECQTMSSTLSTHAECQSDEIQLAKSETVHSECQTEEFVLVESATTNSKCQTEIVDAATTTAIDAEVQTEATDQPVNAPESVDSGCQCATLPVAEAAIQTDEPVTAVSDRATADSAAQTDEIAFTGVEIQTEEFHAATESDTKTESTSALLDSESQSDLARFDNAEIQTEQLPPFVSSDSSVALITAEVTDTASQPAIIHNSSIDSQTTTDSASQSTVETADNESQTIADSGDAMCQSISSALLTVDVATQAESTEEQIQSLCSDIVATTLSNSLLALVEEEYQTQLADQRKQLVESQHRASEQRSQLEQSHQSQLAAQHQQLSQCQLQLLQHQQHQRELERQKSQQAEELIANEIALRLANSTILAAVDSHYQHQLNQQARQHQQFIEDSRRIVLDAAVNTELILSSDTNRSIPTTPIRPAAISSSSPAVLRSSPSTSSAVRFRSPLHSSLSALTDFPSFDLHGRACAAEAALEAEFDAFAATLIEFTRHTNSLSPSASLTDSPTNNHYTNNNNVQHRSNSSSSMYSS